MILSEQHISNIWYALNLIKGIEKPASDEKLKAVQKVLELGNTKQSSEGVSPQEDLQHAINHHNKAASSAHYDDTIKKRYTHDEETNQHHKAHAAARCILAIKKIMEEKWD